MPQILSADGTLTGRENLMVFAKLYDIPKNERVKRIADSLQFMGLSDASDKLVKNYSGGMIRRLEIAQSMLHHPKILFLDEPTIGLDPVGRKAVWDHIQKLRADYGMTIFVTTHYMEEADKLCSRVAIMHLGKLAVIGEPDRFESIAKYRQTPRLKMCLRITLAAPLTEAKATAKLLRQDKPRRGWAKT